MTDYWTDKRVLVTGATGLVGSWVAKELIARGANVIAFVRDWDPQSELIRSGAINRTSVVNGALEDYSAVERAITEQEPDTVFHLGAQAVVGVGLRSPLLTFESNIRGTYHILEACRVHRALVKRLVVASSDKAYGESETLPYVEDMPPLGRHPYDVSKSCGDLLAHAYYHTYDLPLVVARCGNIYGGGDLNWSRIVPGTIRSLYFGERPVIRSNGLYTRDYIYIKDAVNAYLSMAEGLDRAEVHGQAFNFGPEKPLTVIEMVNAIRKAMGCEELEPIILNEARAEIRNQYLSFDKANKMLGWAPTYSLEAGLSETIEWYRDFFHSGGLNCLER